MKVIFDPGLVLYLPLYELDGAAFMSKDAYGHKGTVAGALWRLGGHCFDGVDDYLSVPDHDALDLTTEGTLESWVYIDDLSGVRGVIQRSTNGYGLYVYSTGKVGFGKIGVDELQSNAPLAVNTWYHVVGTRVNGTNSIYLNGAFDISAAKDDWAALNDEIRIGGEPGGGNDFSGLIGEVRIYHRALTCQEIQRNYIATKWRYR